MGSIYKTSQALQYDWGKKEEQSKVVEGEWEGLEDTFSSWNQEPGTRDIASFPNWEGTSLPEGVRSLKHDFSRSEGLQTVLTNYSLAWVGDILQNLGCQSPLPPHP